MKEIEEILSALIQFRNEREWEQFHMSTNSKYQDLILQEDDLIGFEVIGIFRKMLKS